MDKPESLRLKPFLRPLFGVILFIVLAYLGTNCMPFFADGTRMGLVDGIKAIALSGAKGTAPFAKASPENITKITASIMPADLNALTGYISLVGKPFGFDVLTSLALIALLLSAVYQILFKGFRIPFVLLYNSMMRKAWNPKISSGTLTTMLKLRLLIPTAIVFAVCFGVWGLGELGIRSLEGVVDSAAGRRVYTGPAIAFIIALVVTFTYRRWAMGKYKNLIGRRCAKCNAMDSFRWIGGEEFERRHMVKTTTTTHQDGHKSFDTDNYTEVDERNTRRCTNCVYTINTYGTAKKRGHV